MKRTRAIAAVAAGSLGACLAVAPAGASAPEVRLAASSVSVGNNFFSPSSKSVGRGGSISWVWRGGARHNVTGMTRSGRVVFRSRTTSRRGYRYTKRFRSAGRFRVICTLHSGMRMSVRVR